VSLSDALKLSDARVYLADPEGIALNSVDKFNLHNEALSVFVGPPGGFSEKEISTLHQRGALGIKIAQSRLRTELATTVFASQLTAALISCQ
jgi:RsmE family RNA methyltransferase